MNLDGLTISYRSMPEYSTTWSAQPLYGTTGAWYSLNDCNQDTVISGIFDQFAEIMELFAEGAIDYIELCDRFAELKKKYV